MHFSELLIGNNWALRLMKPLKIKIKNSLFMVVKKGRFLSPV
jgi:hypothetical protein